MLSIACRVCAWMPPSASRPVAGSMPICPETNTRSPSIETWEYVVFAGGRPGTSMVVGFMFYTLHVMPCYPRSLYIFSSPDARLKKSLDRLLGGPPMARAADGGERLPRT